MKIWISSLRDVHETAAKARPARAVSLLSPGDAFPVLEGFDQDEHHKVHLHDIREPKEGHVTPGEEHVSGIIRFLSGWNPDDALLVHCWAGMSRSTATAFIGACLHNPHADEKVIAASIANASPTAFPNTRIVSIADEMMACNGRMAAAVEEIFHNKNRLATVSDTLEAQPFHIPAKF